MKMRKSMNIEAKVAIKYAPQDEIRGTSRTVFLNLGNRSKSNEVWET